ncbi:MAG: DUF1080 domain-containing protein [Planctomycetia bacterium]|nr:DUF1080 domain-containing protein [Planctomycetia bacterium]
MNIKWLLATLVLISLATDAVHSAPFARRNRCRSIARNRFQRNTDSISTLSLAASTLASQNLFDGRTLAGWDVIEKYDFERHGAITVKDEAIILEAGAPATGVRVAGDFPRLNYEVSLDAKRIEGSDFFCGITFPVGEDYLSLVLGGWGGGTTGISNLDNMSAVENTTTGYHEFEQDRWYHIRLRVTGDKIEAWIDDEQIVDFEHAKHKLSIWWEQEPVRPFGIASWYTTSALRNIRLTRL